MLILLLIELFFIIIVYKFFTLLWSIIYKIKIDNLLESINTKEDLLFINYKDFLNVISEAFKRKGFKVVITDKCGEEGNGLILDQIKYAEIWKHGLNQIVDVEAAMKLARRMQLNSIHRGMLVTLGDFKQMTLMFCHKNVIECINGDQLLTICKEVQKRKEVLQTN
jgi:restriction system protein